MTTSSDTSNPRRYRQSGPRSSHSLRERPRGRGLAAAVASIAALGIVGAIALSGGEEAAQTGASTPSPQLAITAGAATLDGYWNSYTQEWVPFED